MTEKSIYQSDDYDRESQRFIIPLYIKDEIGTYHFSSTGTLVKYNGFHYIIFAAHALAGNISFDCVHTFTTSGKFLCIHDHAIGHAVYEDDDIVIVDYFSTAFEGKNYFNINLSGLEGLEGNYFSWTGFPRSTAKTPAIHSSKSEETLREQYVRTEDNTKYFTNIQYFTIYSKLIRNDETEIIGHYDPKNAHLKYAGQRSMGPGLSGMSGGAMYYSAYGRVLRDNIDESFRFAGIGLEYRKDRTVFGIPRTKIIALIERFSEENPIRITTK